MVCSGQGVWVACQQSSKVSLFHATTYEFLLEVSVAQAVSQKLQCEWLFLFVRMKEVCYETEVTSYKKKLVRILSPTYHSKLGGWGWGILK